MGPTKRFWGPWIPTFKYGYVYPPPFFFSSALPWIVRSRLQTPTSLRSLDKVTRCSSRWPTTTSRGSARSTTWVRRGVTSRREPRRIQTRPSGFTMFLNEKRVILTFYLNFPSLSWSSGHWRPPLRIEPENGRRGRCRAGRGGDIAFYSWSRLWFVF